MKSSQLRTTLSLLTAVACLSCTLVSGIYLSRLSDEIRQRFDGKRWSLPAVVYARPLELFPGLWLSPQMLEDELQLSGYRRETQLNGAGSYSRNGTTVRLITRDFHFPSGHEPSQHLTVTFSEDQIDTLTATDNGTNLSFVRLDPTPIGSFHPIIHEDRIILTREEIPDLLIETLLTIEDKNYYSHIGISPLAITRALFANIRAGKTVQGGSTLTQQLVKNLFLSRERSLLRKAQEAVMAMLLEVHYSKDEILTAYINEVFLGQDGNRAVHGFALASQFFFRRSLHDLRADQIAVLVGMIKGPSYYDPHRNPQNCLERRQMVLARMAAANLISLATLTHALSLPVTEFSVQKGGFNRFPAFLDLVRQQLAREYREEDLKTNGLQILTTLDPQIQYQVELHLKKTIATLERQPEHLDLEGAVVVTSRETGEVLAIAGGKNPLQNGFNRALKARRPIGSLIKPAVYLAALNRGFTLASPIQDTAITLDTGSGSPWSPENYDRQEHGRVPLYAALANSYNLATVRLGIEVGLDEVISTIGDLGYQEDLQPYPSLLLGAVSMSPLDVSQIYQTLASGGFYTSLRAINSVMAADHTLLNRFGLAVEQRFSPETNYLLTHILQRVITEGTGKKLLQSALRNHSAAGKTGTSDKLRDSWFAGFTGDHLAVVWLGRDDNKPSTLTGSTGALRVWESIMEAIHSSPLKLVEPSKILWRRIDLTTLQPTHPLNSNSTLLPFAEGSEPTASGFPTLDTGPLKKEVRGIFETINSWFN